MCESTLRSWYFRCVENSCAGISCVIWNCFPKSGHICMYPVPYLKEIELAGNIAGQLQGIYVRSYVLTYVRIGGNMYSIPVLNSTARVINIIKAMHTDWIENICIGNNIYECTHAHYKLI